MKIKNFIKNNYKLIFSVVAIIVIIVIARFVFFSNNNDNDEIIAADNDFVGLQDDDKNEDELEKIEKGRAIYGPQNMQLEEDDFVRLDKDGNVILEQNHKTTDSTKKSNNTFDKKKSNLSKQSAASGDRKATNTLETSKAAKNELEKVEGPTKAEEADEKEKKMTVTVNISCHKLLGFATENLRNKIPNEGYLLTSCQVQIDDDDTVYDVLRRVCEAKGMNYSASKGSFGVYVSSIDNLSDSVVGKTAGWCYFVDGNFAKVSASKFKVDDGQTIDWEYDDNWDAGVLE